MIDTDKVISMTKMAAYEKRQGKKDLAVTAYFRNDYVGMQILISIICITAAFCAACGVYVLLNFEEFMQNIYTMDLAAAGKQLLFWYVVALAVYMGITYLIYGVRYHLAHKRVRRFEERLNRLDEDEE